MVSSGVIAASAVGTVYAKRDAHRQSAKPTGAIPAFFPKPGNDINRHVRMHAWCCEHGEG